MISLELWRAKIGLFNCSRPPSSSLFTNLHHHQQSVDHGWFLAGGGSAGLFSSLCRSLLIRRALVLLLVAVISHLLLSAGDVEQNPGPLTAGSPLSVNNLLDACKDVTDWHNLGRHLDLTMSQLRSIEITYRMDGLGRMKAEMFDVWLRNDLNASWTDLITALRAMDEIAIASFIEATIRPAPDVSDPAGSHDLSRTLSSVPPTLLKLKMMKGADGKPLKIVQKIAAHDYTTFGMCLLQDENGEEVALLKKKHIYDGLESVTIAILQKWLLSDAPTRTYQHLIECLRQSELGALAELIEKSIIEQGYYQSHSVQQHHPRPTATDRISPPLPLSASGQPSLPSGSAKKEKVKKYIQEKGEVKVRSLKLFLIGPSRVGKTTTCRRLTHKIVLGSSDIISPSTGIDSPVTVPLYSDIDQSLVNIGKKGWRSQGIGDQFRDLWNFLSKLVSSPSSSSSNGANSGDSSVASQPSESQATAATTGSPQMSHQDQETPTHRVQEYVFDNLEKFPSRAETDDWKTIGEFLENLDLLNIVDIGGQPEFHEILPMLLHGPALNLIFFNVTHDLDSPYTVVYCDIDGPTQMQYKSEFTIKAIIQRALCSISSLETSVALLIGTHLDKSNDEAVRKLDDSIQQLYKDSDFMRKDVLWQVDKVGEEEKYIHSLNNVGGKSNDIEELRRLITQIVKVRFEQESVPTTYLLLHLFLRFKFESRGWCFYEQCEEIAESCGISKEDLPDVLEYLHDNFGTILYYRSLEKLSKRVILNVNLIMKPPSELFATAFGAMKGLPNTAKTIRQTGEIPEYLMKKACSTSSSESCIPTDEIVELLESRYILYKNVQTSRKENVYFLPCLLLPDHNIIKESDNPKFLSGLTYSPLLVIPSTGFIPLGFFQASVVKFSQEKKWKLDKLHRFRNRIRFYFNNRSLHVEIRSLPGCLEVHIVNIATCKQDLIPEFRFELLKVLDEVTSLSPHTKNVHWDLGFYCPYGLEFGKCHPARCEVDSANQEVFCNELDVVACETIGCRETSVELVNKQKCWFMVVPKIDPVEISPHKKHRKVELDSPSGSPLPPAAQFNDSAPQPLTKTPDSVAVHISGGNNAAIAAGEKSQAGGKGSTVVAGNYTVNNNYFPDQSPFQQGASAAAPPVTTPSQPLSGSAANTTPSQLLGGSAADPSAAAATDSPSGSVADKPPSQTLLIFIKATPPDEDIKIKKIISTVHDEVTIKGFAQFLLNDELTVAGIMSKNYELRKLVDEVLTKWLHSARNCTWKHLIESMEKAAMEQTYINNIKKYVL